MSIQIRYKVIVQIHLARTPLLHADRRAVTQLTVTSCNFLLRKRQDSMMEDIALVFYDKLRRIT